MNATHARELLAEALGSIAPEVDLSTIPADALLRDAADLDSMDFMSLVIELSDLAGFDIPEADYARLSSIDAIGTYLAARSG